MVKQFQWYPADEKKRNLRKKKSKATKLRRGIVPGSVLVLLAGRFRGKRVVFVKQLDSGLLLVTGPHKVNGVPLKRVNQVYTITTSAKVDLKGVDASKISDKTFTRDKKAKAADAKHFFAEGAKKKILNADRVANQKAVDGAILANIKADKKSPLLKKYLSARFSLTKNDRPHAMKF
jgi:large subunit ribosomal protein L6e